MLIGQPKGPQLPNSFPFFNFKFNRSNHFEPAFLEFGDTEILIIISTMNLEG